MLFQNSNLERHMVYILHTERYKYILIINVEIWGSVQNVYLYRSVFMNTRNGGEYYEK